MSKEGNGADINDGPEDEDSEELSGTEDTIILSEESLKDQESDTADTAIRRITAQVPQAPKAGAHARRRVEDYLEMKRAARELNDLDEFDLD